MSFTTTQPQDISLQHLLPKSFNLFQLNSTSLNSLLLSPAPLIFHPLVFSLFSLRATITFSHYCWHSAQTVKHCHITRTQTLTNSHKPLVHKHQNVATPVLVHIHKNVPTPPVQGRPEISRTSKILQELTAPLHFLRISSCVYSGPQKFTTRAHTDPPKQQDQQHFETLEYLK